MLRLLITKICTVSRNSRICSRTCRICRQFWCWSCNKLRITSVVFSCLWTTWNYQTLKKRRPWWQKAKWKFRVSHANVDYKKKGKKLYYQDEQNFVKCVNWSCDTAHSLEFWNTKKSYIKIFCSRFINTKIEWSG